MGTHEWYQKVFSDPNEEVPQWVCLWCRVIWEPGKRGRLDCRGPASGRIHVGDVAIQHRAAPYEAQPSDLL
jgi:hypothetical protein